MPTHTVDQLFRLLALLDEGERDTAIVRGARRIVRDGHRKQTLTHMTVAVAQDGVRVRS